MANLNNKRIVLVEDNIGNQTIVVGIDGSATKGRPDHAGTHGTAHQAALAAR